MADPLDYTPLDFDIAVRTVDGEAGSEPLEGQIAVAWVIRTRATWIPPSWWGSTIAVVCKKSWQFACWSGGRDTDRIEALENTSAEYEAIAEVVRGVLDGVTENPAPDCTHYLVRGTQPEPRWKTKADAEGIVPFSLGAQDFYPLSPSF